jgi:modification target Cys-rich repeat protein
MKKFVFGLGAIVAPSLIGGMLVAGCGEDGNDPLGSGSQALCGDCGTIATGDVGISGDARLDGFFKALSNMQNATATIKADFDGNIRALAAVYNVEFTGEVNATVVGQLNAAIEADIDANVQGNLIVDYQPPRCQASVNVAVQAQAKCEAKAECMADVNPGELSVKCEGTCSGGCSAGCSGDFSCEVEAPSIECTGRCEGACNLEAGGTCSGTCRGECDGMCAIEDADGNCAGECTGDCTGTCELTVAAECSGSCSGKCLVNQGSAQCTGSVSCRGSCTGECSGGCEGNFTPPSASVDCDAAVDCQASAKAEANASLECTPPQLTIDYDLNLAASLAGRGTFAARLSELKVRGLAIVQGAAKYEALINGKVNGEVVFDPSPLVELTASVQGFANANAFADFNIGTARIPCVLAAFTEARPILTGLANSTTATISAQTSFVSAFTSGYSS